MIDIEKNVDAYPFTVSDECILVKNESEAHRYYVRGMVVPGAEEIAEGAFITPETPVMRMHQLAGEARANGKDVFFAGIWD